MTVCIVNHDGARHLAASLRALEGRQADFDEVLLLDNASTDESVELFRRLFPAGRVLRLEANRGPAAARNAGFAAARNDSILFIDNDVSLTSGCASALCKALEGFPAAVAAAPRILYADDPETVQYEGAECHFLGQMILRNADRPADRCGTETARVGSLVTAGFLLDRGRWGPEAPFDEDFCFYYEDQDFGLRARLLGHEILAVPSAIALHGGGTPGLSMRPGGEYGRLRVFTLITGRWQAILKSFSLRTLVLLAPCLLLYEVAQLAVALKKGWGREWAGACAWMLRHLPATLRKRRALQRRRRVPDRDILRGGPLPLRPELSQSGLERAAVRALDALTSAYWKRVWTRI